MQRSVVRILITILLSAVLLLTLQKTPVNKQVLPRASVHRTTVVPKVSTAPKIVQPQPVKEAVAIPQLPQGCAAYVPLLQQYDWNYQVMAAVMQAESGCNPNAISNANINYDGIPDYGLMQLHGQEILDPVTNIAHAYAIWQRQGYTAWSTYKSGAYLRYL